ncbi:MAG TPA: hypothetical protein VIV60_27735, partial [Polyangiaceae bacterium]
MKARFLLRLALVPCLLLNNSAALAADPVNPEAVKHFNAGLAYVDDPTGSKWEEAYKEFRTAYAIHPSWKLANNIGLAALQLERDGEAIEFYNEYLKSGDVAKISASQRKQMEKDIAMLTASLVRVNITIVPAEAMLIDERRNSKGGLIVNQYPIKDGKASLGLHPGTHQITVQAAGYVSANWTVNGDPSSTHQHDFKLEPEKKPETAAPRPAAAPEKPLQSTTEPPESAVHHTPTSVYVGIAATGVFAAAATVTGVIALSKNKDYENATDLTEANRIKDSGKTYVLLTDIGVGAAVVSAGVTAYLYFSAPKAKPEKASSASIQLSPAVSPSAAGLAMFGKF